MKSSCIWFILLSTLLFFYNCTNSEFKQTQTQEEIIQTPKPSLKFSDDSTGIVTLLTEGKVLTAWEDFKKALLKNNLDEIRTLSTSCIACESCGPQKTISIDTFFNKYFAKRFNRNLLSRMSDTAKVIGHYDDANWNIYSQDCIFNSSGLLKPRIAEIGIRISDPNSLYKGFEGGTAAIAFIETKSGYKFCGYSTIP